MRIVFVVGGCWQMCCGSLIWLSPCVFTFFFFKQKTAYEMRISDWSSDVCSSDLRVDDKPRLHPFLPRHARRAAAGGDRAWPPTHRNGADAPADEAFLLMALAAEILFLLLAGAASLLLLAAGARGLAAESRVTRRLGRVGGEIGRAHV